MCERKVVKFFAGTGTKKSMHSLYPTDIANNQNSGVYFSFPLEWVEYGWLSRPRFLSSIAIHPIDRHKEVRPKVEVPITI